MESKNVIRFCLKFKAIYKYLCFQTLNFQTFRYFSSRHVDVSFFTFQPDKRSNSTPIVILHGFLGSKQNWRALAKNIAKKSDRQVYALDARNHGESPHSDYFSYDLMCEDVKKFMSQQSICKTVFIGHSMGGRTAMKLALTEKHLVDKLIVVDVSPVKMPKSSSEFIPTYLSAMKNALSFVQNLGIVQARKVVDEYFSQYIPEVPIRQFLLTNLIEKDGKIKWKANIEVLERTFQSEICNFSGISGCFMEETLFICGKESSYVKENDYPLIRKLFPRAEFVVVPGAGHWVHSEKPSEFLEALCKFL